MFKFSDIINIQIMDSLIKDINCYKYIMFRCFRLNLFNYCYEISIKKHL